ncbi:MAG: ribose-phosphate diphosphokinase [Chitinivibrionales bacterium]|nr:ribose-phosphate diphosphokinase [Chitinivibrionales bacterium]
MRDKEQERTAEEQPWFPPRGKLLLAGCRSGEVFTEGVYNAYRRLYDNEFSEGEIAYLKNIDSSFSDSETYVRLQRHVGGCDVFLFQSLKNPTDGSDINDNYCALLIAARAFREHGARHVTAVLPYLAYSRQDKPTRFKREPTTAALMANLAQRAGIDRVVTWHPHSRQIHGFYGNTPVNELEPLTYFVNQFKDMKGRDDVTVVAPDAGAAKMAIAISERLHVAHAIASKSRPGPEKVEHAEIIGDFSNKTTAIICDDIISSGQTIEKVVQKLTGELGITKIYICISHCLYAPKAYEALERMHEQNGMQCCIVTDSIPPTEKFSSLHGFHIHSLTHTFARVIHNIHREISVSKAFFL